MKLFLVFALQVATTLAFSSQSQFASRSGARYVVVVETRRDDFLTYYYQKSTSAHFLLAVCSLLSFCAGPCRLVLILLLGYACPTLLF